MHARTHAHIHLDYNRSTSAVSVQVLLYVLMTGLSVAAFRENEGLQQNFNLVATSHDRLGEEYVAIVEAKRVRVSLNLKPSVYSSP